MNKGFTKQFKHLSRTNTENFVGISFLRFKKKLGVNKVTFYWDKYYLPYFANNNMKLKTQNLKQGLDKISCEYVDKFMKLSKHWNKNYYTNPYTKYDMVVREVFKKRNFQQPYPEITRINEFIFTSKYGLKDLPENILNSINGKDIIDIGGFNGDTAVLFNQMFPSSKVFVYEPLKHWISKLELIKEKGKLTNVIPINKGLSNKEEETLIRFYGAEEMCTITTLNKDYQGNNLGLIKMDTEGFESSIIEGAKDVIIKQKPILAIAIYHRPEDFFDMKEKLKRLNPNYRFMIRRSEQIIPTADLVLIAY